jgi:hypothetical protein
LEGRLAQRLAVRFYDINKNSVYEFPNFLETALRQWRGADRNSLISAK